MSEWGVVQIVLAQALTYVIPGWIFGLAMAQLFLTFIFNIMVREREREKRMTIGRSIQSKPVLLQQSKYTLVPIFAWLSVSALLFSIRNKTEEEDEKEKRNKKVSYFLFLDSSRISCSAFGIDRTDLDRTAEKYRSGFGSKPTENERRRILDSEI